MTTKSIIVAIDQNNAIGKDNNLLCHLPNDLKYFKQTTSGHTVIMGRKTFQSLPNGALPNRQNIVLSGQKLAFPNCVVCASIPQALELCTNDEEVFFIGGATIYAEALKIADKLYVTEIEETFEGADAFFPQIDTTQWAEVERIDNPTDEKNKYAHTFVVYERI